MDNENIVSDTSSVAVFYFSEILLAGEKKSWECFLLSMNEVLYEIIDFFFSSV